MSHRHRVKTREIGQLRIYVPRGASLPGTGIKKRLFGRPLYRDLIELAKSDNIVNASVHPTQHGYTQGGQIQADDREVPNPHLSMCIELIDQRGALELFCRKHATMLKGFVIVYKHLEHWELHHDDIDVSDASVEELHDDGSAAQSK